MVDALAVYLWNYYPLAILLWLEFDETIMSILLNRCHHNQSNTSVDQASTVLPITLEQLEEHIVLDISDVLSNRFLPWTSINCRELADLKVKALLQEWINTHLPS